MTLTRREICLAGASFLLTACGDPGATPPPKSKEFALVDNLILGGGKFKDTKTGEIKHIVSIVELSARKHTLIDTNFLPHGLHRKPSDTNCVAVFEKIGPGACEIDLAERRIIRTLEVAKGRYFYGHGAYSVDGGLLFSTETQRDSGDGVIAIRDSKTMAPLGEFPSFGKEPHECKLIDDGAIMVVSNGGGSLNGSSPCVTYIDVATQKLIEKVELTNANLNTGHFAVNNNGSLVVISAPRAGLGKEQLGGVSIRPREDSMHSISNPVSVTQRMQGEALSVAIHPEAGIAAVTHPDGDMVTIWSISDRRLVKMIPLPKARGVELTKNMRNFVVSFGATANLMLLPVDTLELDQSSLLEATYITGSHIYNWSREMSELFYPGPLV